MKFKMVILLMVFVTMSGCSCIELSLFKYESRKVAIPDKVALAKSSVALAEIVNNKTPDNEIETKMIDPAIIAGVVGLLKTIYSQINPVGDVNKEIVEVKEFSILNIKLGDNDKRTKAFVGSHGDIVAEFVD